ncbi:MAG: Na+/H+ antiporter NhaA [Ferruginibacter sp.]
MKRIPKLIRKHLVAPFFSLINDSRTVGIILLLCTALSLWLANSAASETYLGFIHYNVHLPEFLHLPHTVLHWINDGLMAVFFFLVGLEIKRESTSGELASIQKALLPIIGAIGGMLLPATIYWIINHGTDYANGWGIPMATDIAFSLGVASLLGKRFPLGLKIFLTALAIIDDLGAILTIAIFYSASIQFLYLLAAAVIVIVLAFLMQNKKYGVFNYVLGILLWYCFLQSGIHATLAGVVFALFIPSNRLEIAEHRLHKPVNFLVIPIFALANTSIILPNAILVALNTGLSWGVLTGLVIGKPLGIVGAAYISVKMKWAALPAGISWKHIWGAGLLAGIGFTMSIFIATLAFSDAAFTDIAKIATMLASFISILLGVLWIRFFCKPLTV